MANMAARMTAAFFDSKGVRYQLLGDDQEIIKVGFNQENRDNVQVLLVFDEKNTVAVKTYDYVKFQAAKKEVMYKTCNEMNAKFRFDKFYVDESDNTITVEDDGVIQLDSCGEECLELVLRMVNITDEAYPAFMRALFA